VSSLTRLLDVIRRDLGAIDARAEIGGRDPEDPRVVFCRLAPEWRIVACFEQPPADREHLTERLRALTETFKGVAPSGDEFVAIGRELATRRLDDELELLADRAGAVAAVVIDAQSPVIWGTSTTRRVEEDVDAAVATAEALEAADRAEIDFADLLERDPDAARARLAEHGVDARIATFLAREAERVRRESRRSGSAWRQHLLLARAIAAVRKRQADDVANLREMVRHEHWAYLARSFASIYCLVLVFDEKFSELHAEGAVVHALPHVERLVLALPPIDPPPRPGKLISLKSNR
jgi:hypothetical protein